MMKSKMSSNAFKEVKDFDGSCKGKDFDGSCKGKGGMYIIGRSIM